MPDAGRVAPISACVSYQIDRSKSTFETRERTVMPGLCALMGATRLASGYFQHFNPYSSASAHCHISSLAYQPILLGVSPYVLSATRTSVRGRPPRSGLMSLCAYVLMFPALAAAKPRYGVSPYVSYSMGRSPHTKVMSLM